MQDILYLLTKEQASLFVPQLYLEVLIQTLMNHVRNVSCMMSGCYFSPPKGGEYVIGRVCLLLVRQVCYSPAFITCRIRIRQVYQSVPFICQYVYSPNGVRRSPPRRLARFRSYFAHCQALLRSRRSPIFRPLGQRSRSKVKVKVTLFVIFVFWS